jgi:hypothetical protein
VICYSNLHCSQRAAPIVVLECYGSICAFWIPVRFGALEEVFMSYRPHGAWRTMEVLEELA